MLLDNNLMTRAFKQKLLRSPRLYLKKNTKKSRKSEQSVAEEDQKVGGKVGVMQSCISLVRQDKHLTIPDTGDMLTSRSAEDLSTIHHLQKQQQKLPEQCCSSSKRRESNLLSTLPVPLSLALGITSLSDSKLYDYHSSQEFLTFLTNSARSVEEARRTSTINTALTQIKELTELVDENTQILRVVTHTQEYNPSTEIDDIIVKNIADTLKEHRETVRQMCERAKEYKNQLILAESDLDTNIAQEMKSDLTAMNRNLSWMSMLVRYHTWGASAVDDNQYHSDDDIISRHRKLDRRNCIRVRDRPKWSEGAPEDVPAVINTPPDSGKYTNKQIINNPSLKTNISKSARQTVVSNLHSSGTKRTTSRTNEG